MVDVAGRLALSIYFYTSGNTVNRGPSTGYEYMQQSSPIWVHFGIFGPISCISDLGTLTSRLARLGTESYDAHTCTRK